jgi:hypothetical protein
VRPTNKPINKQSVGVCICNIVIYGGLKCKKAKG